MSKIEFNDIDLSGSSVRKAPAPLEGFFVPGVGLVESIAVSEIGYTLKPVIMLRPDQKRKIDEARRHIENGNASKAIPLFSGAATEQPIEDIVEEGEGALIPLEPVAPVQPELVSLGFEVHLALTLETDGEVGEPELFYLATVEADITDLYEEPGEDEEPTYMYNVVEMFDAHVKHYTDLIIDALTKSEQYRNRAASIMAQTQSAAARTGELSPSPEYETIKNNIQTLDRNALSRITKLVTTPTDFIDQAIGYDDPEKEDEAPVLAPVDFNNFYAYLQGVTNTPDDLAFKILQAHAKVQQHYSFADDESEEAEAQPETEADDQ